VDLRHELAHGRIAVLDPQTFPLTYFKFREPVKGREVTVATRVKMTEAWFDEQRTLVHNALQAVHNEQQWGAKKD
jgi:hypothetical protein